MIQVISFQVLKCMQICCCFLKFAQTLTIEFRHFQAPKYAQGVIIEIVQRDSIEN